MSLKKALKAEPVLAEQNKPKYDLLSKPHLQKECGLIKSGNKSDLVARLESTDKARRDKYANAKNAPSSSEEAAKRPIGAKAPPSKSQAGFSKNGSCEKILKRGPSGPPVYDEMGFEIDYNKSLRLEQENREQNRKTQIIGMDKNKASALSLMAWDDRILRDLGIPYHTVEIEDFEEWHRRGSKTEGEEFKEENISEEERDRLDRIAIGSAFRK